MPDVIVGPSAVQGTGVFAARDFAANETVLLLDDSRVVDGQNPLRRELDEREHHCDYLAGSKVVLMQAPARYINSSCDPNTYVRTIDGTRCVIALRQIGTGEEITYDYLVNCHGGVRWRCNCGSSRCRGEVPASFFDLPKADQLRLRPLLDTWFMEEHGDRIEALMSGPALRPAVVGDVPALLALQAGYYAEDKYPYVESLAGKAWAGLLSNPGFGAAWIIEEQSQVVGYVVMTLGYSLEYRGQDAFIDEVYVAPAWRGRGLGHRLLEAVDAACRTLDVKALHLEVEKDKTAAQALYRRWGFADRQRVLMTKRMG